MMQRTVPSPHVEMGRGWPPCGMPSGGSTDPCRRARGGGTRERDTADGDMTRCFLPRSNERNKFTSRALTVFKQLRVPGQEECWARNRTTFKPPNPHEGTQHDQGLGCKEVAPCSCSSKDRAHPLRKRRRPRRGCLLFTTPPTSQPGGTLRLDGWLQQRCTG